MGFECREKKPEEPLEETFEVRGFFPFNFDLKLGFRVRKVQSQVKVERDSHMVFHISSVRCSFVHL